jgi:arginine decarboxylase
MSEGILNYLLQLDVKEIHGYRPELGLKVFREESLRTAAPGTKAEASRR